MGTDSAAMTVDTTGNIYVMSYPNGTIYLVTPNGTVTSLVTGLSTA
jgi:sugar lactone lactonase YvrE